jgi:hypothetical protein
MFWLLEIQQFKAEYFIINFQVSSLYFVGLLFVSVMQMRSHVGET